MSCCRTRKFQLWSTVALTLHLNTRGNLLQVWMNMLCWPTNVFSFHQAFETFTFIVTLHPLHFVLVITFLISEILLNTLTEKVCFFALSFFFWRVLVALLLENCFCLHIFSLNILCFSCWYCLSICLRSFWFFKACFFLSSADLKFKTVHVHLYFSFHKI